MQIVNTAVRIAETAAEQSPKDKVLESIKFGMNSLRGIQLRTGLDVEVIRNELRVLENLYIIKMPAPPVISYWLKNDRPVGKLFTRDGLKVEVQPFTEDELTPKKPEIKQAQAQAPVNFAGIGKVSAEQFKDIPLGAIEMHPENPRDYVDIYEDAFLQLVESVREVGIQEPLIVAPNAASGKFRIIMGHRRYKAAEHALHETAPCVIRVYDNLETEISAMLIENIQRANLKPSQEARAFDKLYLKLNKDVNAVARKTGFKQSFITNRLRLLKCDQVLQEMVDRREIGLNAAIVLSKLPADDQVKNVPRARRMKISELKTFVDFAVKGLKKPPQWKKPKRVTTDEETFTRSWALKALKSAGETYFPAEYFINSFNDVCQDACVESGDEKMCQGCPVPRLIAAMLRHREKGEQ